jgi:hypothetical protein
MLKGAALVELLVHRVFGRKLRESWNLPSSNRDIGLISLICSSLGLRRGLGAAFPDGSALNERALALTEKARQ